MKRYIYPAVVYNDGPVDSFCLVVPDLNLVTEGGTIEEAFEFMKEYIEGYFECALMINEDIKVATPFDKLAKSKSKNIVLLIDVKVQDDKVS